MTPCTQSSIRLGLAGMTPDNGHRWSWPAIINGFDPAAMRRCPFEVIFRYLSDQPPGTVSIADAEVTHIWTEDRQESVAIAAATKIAQVCSRPEDLIGNVDGVLIPTDDGDEHVRRAEPFIAAGIPVFIDKPLATNLAGLARFRAWKEEGRPFLSSSAMRYRPELIGFARDPSVVGELRWLSSTTVKSWETYGIHALEAIQVLLGGRFESLSLHPTQWGSVADVRHNTGAVLTIPVMDDAFGSFGLVQVCGLSGHRFFPPGSNYEPFQAQLIEFAEYIRTGAEPFSFEETIELMLVIIAGIRSRDRGGERILLDDLRQELNGLYA